MAEKLVIGRVLSSHGVRGEVKVKSLSGEDSHFKALDTVVIRYRGRDIEKKLLSVRGALPNLIIAFEGITSPEEARKYRGAEVLVDREHAAPLKDGEYYFADLTGCKVHFEGEEKGTVTSVWENVNCDMLELELKDGQIVQVPLQDQFVADVDTGEKRIELRVDWILE